MRAQAPAGLTMKFGLRYCNTCRYTDPAQAVELVQAGEEAGFDSAWTIEHTVVPGGYQSTYPYAPEGRMPGRESEFVPPDPLMWIERFADTRAGNAGPPAPPGPS